MSRTARLLEIMIWLRTRSRFTVADLAEEFAVSRRTMLRDLRALTEMGVPLAAVPGRHGGYSLITGQRMLPLSLTVDEAIGLVISYEAFLQYARSPFSEQSLSAITKLRNAIPPDVTERLDRIHQHVAVVEPQPSYEAPFLSQLLQVCLDGAHVRITYDSRSGRSERLIFPYGLYASSGFWYCACHDYTRADTLSLRVDRVLSLQRVEGPERPPAVSQREWLRTRETNGHPSLHLRAAVTRRGARSFELHSLFGEIPLDKDGQGLIDAEIPASEVDFHAARLLAVGADLRVDSPPQLIDAIRRRAQEVLDLYQAQPAV